MYQLASFSEGVGARFFNEEVGERLVKWSGSN